MPAYFGARGPARETKQVRADAAALRLSVNRYRLAALTQAQKIALLARAIAQAAAQRGEVELADCTRSGLTEREVKDLYDCALGEARRMDPALLGATPW